MAAILSRPQCVKNMRPLCSCKSLLRGRPLGTSTGYVVTNDGAVVTRMANSLDGLGRVLGRCYVRR